MLPVIKQSPDRQAELKDLVTKAQAALKSGDERTATEAVDAVEAALGSGGAGPAVAAAADAGASAPEKAAAAPNAAVLQKSRTAWVATRKRIEAEIGKLHDAMAKHYDGHGFAADLDKVFQAKIEPILTRLDQSLASKLDEVGKSTDPAQHQKLVGEAQQIIGRYEKLPRQRQPDPATRRQPIRAPADPEDPDGDVGGAEEGGPLTGPAPRTLRERVRGSMRALEYLGPRPAQRGSPPLPSSPAGRAYAGWSPRARRCRTARSRRSAPRSGSTFSATPCQLTHRVTRTPMAAIFGLGARAAGRPPRCRPGRRAARRAR